MKFLIVALILFPGVCWAQSNGLALPWIETGGPPGGAVTSVCVDSSGRLFIGSEAAGVFESTNGGNLWYTRNTGLSTFHMLDLEASPKDYIFAITYDGGVFRFYHDDNPVWTLLDTTVNFGSIASMACSAHGDVFLGTGNYGILRSTDNGVTWEHPDSGIASYVTGFPILTTSSGGLIALGHYRDSTKRDAYNIYRSTNDGGEWQLLATAPGSTRPTAFLALNVDTLFYGNLSGTLYRSIDGGLDWGIIFKDSGAFAINNIVRSPKNGQFFLRTEDGKLFLSSNFGTSWNFISSDTLGGNIYATAIDSTGILFVGTDFEGMLRSTDQGANFATINAQLSASLIYDVAVSKASDLYAATEQLVWRSPDHGHSWSKCNITVGEDLADPAIAIDSANDLYLGNATGVWVSHDSGNSWINSLGGHSSSSADQCFQIVTDPKGNVFAATHQGLYESSDRGKTWVKDTSGYKGVDAEGIVIGHDGNLYAQDGTGVTYRSTDGGYYWTLLSSNQAGIAAVRHDGILLASSGHRVYRSVDDAVTWEAVWIPDSVRARSVNRIYLDSHENVFASTDSGIYVSTDAGISWQSISEGFADPTAIRLSAATDICEDTRTGIYYAASRGQGVFRSQPQSAVPQSIPPSMVDLTNAPNPFQEATVISFTIPEESSVSIELHNTLGIVIWAQSFPSLPAGTYHTPISNPGLSSGSYLCTLRTHSGEYARWITLIR